MNLQYILECGSLFRIFNDILDDKSKVNLLLCSKYFNSLKSKITFNEHQSICDIILKYGDQFSKERIRKENYIALRKISYLRLNGFEKDKKLPKEIKLLKNLIHLDLVSNHLSDLPEELSELNKLQHVNLNGNDFEHIPQFIIDKKIKNLQSLSMHNNPLITLPISLKDILYNYPHHLTWN